MSHVDNYEPRPWDQLKADEVKTQYQRLIKLVGQQREEIEKLREEAEEDCRGCERLKKEYKEVCDEADETERRRKVMVKAWNAEIWNGKKSEIHSRKLEKLILM